MSATPLQNRVTPEGEIVADPARGTLMGNRGCLHRADRTLGVTRWRSKMWICCVLRWRDVRRDVMPPGRWTALFFLDEATALAAGHRPCGECRYTDYVHLTALWADLHPGQIGADAIDEQLDGERRDPHTKQRRFHQAGYDELPDGAFVLVDNHPHLVLGAHLLTWSPAGYTDRTDRPAGGTATATVITPPSLVALLRTDRTPLVPLVHPSAVVSWPWRMTGD